MQDDLKYWYGEKSWWGSRRAITWEGWAFDIGVCVAALAIVPYVNAPTHPFKSLGLFFALLLVMAAVRHFKGEPRR